MSGRESIGFVGLGGIGAPIAHRIVNMGFGLVVWNRSRGKMQPVLAAGAQGAESARDLGRHTDIVFTCVDSTAAMDEVLFGAEGIVCDGVRASLIVDLSTMPPRFEQEIGRRLRTQAGIDFIDVPVSGGPPGARAGTLAAMAGGEVSSLERARPVIESFTSRITHMGLLGAGQVAKACNQIISMGTMGAIAEAIAIGSRCGIDIRRLPGAVSGGFGDSSLMRELERSWNADDSSPIRTIIEALVRLDSGNGETDWRSVRSLVLKDLGIALELGRDAGTVMPVTAQMDSRFRSLFHEPE